MTALAAVGAVALLLGIWYIACSALVNEAEKRDWL